MIQALYERLNQHAKLVPQEAPNDGLGLLVLNISEGCNLNCTYCFADRGHYGAPKATWMDSATATTAIAHALSEYKNVKAIKFFGGEPFLRMNTVLAASEFARSHAPQEPTLVAISNLTIYNDTVREWIQTYKPKITASIDGPQQIHDKFRIFANGDGSFLTVDANIKRMLKDTGEPCALECVYSPVHFKERISMVDLHSYLVSRYQVDEVILHPIQGDREMPGVSVSDTAAYAEEIYELAVDYGRHVMKYALSSANQNKIKTQLKKIISSGHAADAHCGLGVHTLTVRANGDITPCYTLIGHEEFSMGSIYDREPHEAFQSVQSRFLSTKKTEADLCRSCSILSTCHSCPGDMYLTYGTLNSPVMLSCNFQTGVTEGRILGLNEFAGGDSWSNVIGLL